MATGSERRFDEPPPGFAVLREVSLDPDTPEDRWVVRGYVEGRSVIGSGLRSRSAACRAGWLAYDDAVARLGHAPVLADIANFDAAVAEVLARRHAIERERLHTTATMRESYRVPLDSWTAMTANLLWQILADAGSIRRAAKIVEVPRATLATRIKRHKARGTWPE